MLPCEIFGLETYFHLSGIKLCTSVSSFLWDGPQNYFYSTGKGSKSTLVYRQLPPESGLGVTISVSITTNYCDWLLYTCVRCKICLAEKLIPFHHDKIWVTVLHEHLLAVSIDRYNSSLTLNVRALDSLPGDGKLECLIPREEVCGVLSSKFTDWNQW